MRTLFHLVLLSSTVACISPKRFKAMEANYQAAVETNDQLLADLKSQNSQNKALDAQNSDLTRQKSNLESDVNALETDVQRKERALRELQARQARADQRVQEYRDLVSRFADLIDAGTLSVKVIDGRMVVQLPTDILFPSGSAELSADGQKQLAEVGAVLATMPRTYQVEGHTDSDPINTARFPSNWELASARATTVLHVLSQAGVPVDHLSTSGFADTRPVAPNDVAENKKLNRRIEIALTPDLSLLPGFEALTDAARDGAVTAE